MLLERDEELRRLGNALALARHGRGTTVLVSGEAGIGKTSLLREFAGRAGEDARVLFGACEDLLAPRAFGPFRDMLRDVRGVSAPERPDRDGYIEAFLVQMGTSSAPAVVMVDDAHWADDASIDIIRYLGRRIDRLAALLIVTYRPGDLAEHHPLRRVVGALTTRATLRLELKGLSDAAVARLADEAGVDAAALVATVRGNPFYVTEVLAAGGSGVPATVRDAVIGRLGGLPEPTCRALEALSVVPTTAERALVDDMLGTATWALDPAERMGMVEASANGIRFRHELARRALEESLPGSVRVDLNRRVLGWLTAQAAEPSRIVHHAVAAHDSNALTRFAPVAAHEAAAAEAHTETAAFTRLALEREDLLDAEMAARLHGLAAHALYALNRFGEALAHAARAAQEWRALDGSPLELGDALLVCSRMHTMVGDPGQARAEIEQALSILEPLGLSPALAHAHGMMGNLDAIEANNASAAQWCRRAVGEARAVGRPDIEAHARNYLGLARVGLGDLHGFEDLRAAVKLAAELDHGDYLCRAALNQATATIWLGRHPEALPYLDVAEAAAREHGLDHHAFHALVQRCHVDLYVGRWDAAERVLRRQLATEGDPAALMIIPLALLGRIQARRGDPEASSLVARAWELATRSRQVHRMALAGAAVIEEAWLRGDSEVVRSTAAVLLPIADRANLGYLRGEALRYLRRVGAPVEAGGSCPDGFAAGTAGDWARAAAAWAAAGNPYEQALELIESPDPRVAFDGLRRLDGLGAAGTAALVRRELRRRGVDGVPRGPRSATKANPAGLTARQFDVLALLGRGLTSAEIAERLYLSRRTVENHVAGILARLGVSTRRRAVEVAVEMGWLPVSARILGSPDAKDE